MTRKKDFSQAHITHESLHSLDNQTLFKSKHMSSNMIEVADI